MASKILGSALVGLLLLQTAATAQTLPLPSPLTTPLRQTAMPELGESNVEKILSRYYNDGLGGAENWAKLESLKMVGEISLDSGGFKLSAFQKKPNLMKMSIRHLENQSTIDLSYDGSIAWQQLPKQAAEPMPEAKARRFAHSAVFGSYLLFPYAEGKRIEFIDTVPTEGSICHHLRVTLDNGFQVDYYLDIRSFLEVKVVNTDLRNDTTNTIIYREYSRESGWPVAVLSESYEDGKRVSTLRIKEVRVNTGVMPWMFKMP